MDPTVRELVNGLDDRLGHLSSQMEELRESVRQVVVVAEADPEMALTKARKVLEGVLRRVWEHFIPNEPIGTRPLEEVLQRLQKNGYLPRKQAAYAVAVKELGNVGTHVHGEKVDKADVVQALSPLISVLEWYFEQDWVEGAVPADQGGPSSPPAPGGNQKPVGPVAGPAWRPRHLIQLAVGLAVMLAVVTVAGLFVTFRGRTGQPIVPPTGQPTGQPIGRPVVEAAPSDQERIQGRWQGVEGHHSKKHDFDTQAGATKAVWTFRGAHLTLGRMVDGEEDIPSRGSFSLSQGVERKLFDFAGTLPDGSPIEMKGIFEFEGEFLKVCWGFRLDPANTKDFVRPDSFMVSPGGSRRVYLKLMRVGK